MERLRQLLYPNLYASGNQEGAGDGGNSNQLHTIDEDAEEKVITNYTYVKLKLYVITI